MGVAAGQGRGLRLRDSCVCRCASAVKGARALKRTGPVETCARPARVGGRQDLAEGEPLTARSGALRLIAWVGGTGIALQLHSTRTPCRYSRPESCSGKRADPPPPSPLALPSRASRPLSLSSPLSNSPPPCPSTLRTTSPLSPSAPRPSRWRSRCALALPLSLHRPPARVGVTRSLAPRSTSSDPSHHTRVEQLLATGQEPCSAHLRSSQPR